MPFGVREEAFPKVGASEFELAERDREGGEVSGAGDADDWVGVTRIAAADPPRRAGMGGRTRHSAVGVSGDLKSCGRKGIRAVQRQDVHRALGPMEHAQAKL